MGQGNIKHLVTVFGSEDNLHGSNHRQVERIARRCRSYNIQVKLDVETGTYKAEHKAKDKLLENIQELTEKDLTVYTRRFGRFKITKKKLSN